MANLIVPQKVVFFLFTDNKAQALTNTYTYQIESIHFEIGYDLNHLVLRYKFKLRSKNILINYLLQLTKTKPRWNSRLIQKKTYLFSWKQGEVRIRLPSHLCESKRDACAAAGGGCSVLPQLGCGGEDFRKGERGGGLGCDVCKWVWMWVDWMGFIVLRGLSQT